METLSLYDLNFTFAEKYLKAFKYPWEALAGLKDFIISLGKTLKKSDFAEVLPNVWVHKSAEISSAAHLGAPCIIGEETEVRHCAFIRGGALIGRGCVVGNSTELKNVILFDGVQAPHFNYVGDSILGHKAHLGAGAITSNIKSDKSPVSIKAEGQTINTGLKKVGAFVGDFVEVGCNSVLNPGTVIGRNTNIYPLSSVRGVIPESSIYKGGGEITAKK
ncbi:MAG: UDP-N-acetylglucosamine pyrophosphorylase [Clostridia bacterium]|nr:UDP-N-acetylglucosamine pyrophosphorylase [Clostridia bacterium]